MYFFMAFLKTQIHYNVLVYCFFKKTCLHSKELISFDCLHSNELISFDYFLKGSGIPELKKPSWKTELRIMTS